MLKNAESDAQLKGLDVGYLVTEHNRMNQAPQRWHGIQSSRLDWPLHGLSLPHWDGPYWKGAEHTVPKPEEEVAQKKKTPQKRQKLTVQE